MVLMRYGRRNDSEGYPDSSTKARTISVQELVEVVDPERGDRVISVARRLAKHVPEYLRKEVPEDKTNTYTYVQPEKSPTQVVDVYRNRVKELKKLTKRRKEKHPAQQIVNVEREVQLEREAKEVADEALLERLNRRIKAEQTAAAARELKVRRIAGATFTLLLMLAGAVAAHVWLRSAPVTTDPNMPTGPTNETQTQMGTMGRGPADLGAESSSIRQANDVVKPEAAPARDALQALIWSGPETFRGEIAHGLKIDMKLLREGSKLSGSYYYERIGTDILVRGRTEETGNLVLEEFVKGRKTGIFNGKFVSDERIEGKWSRPDGIRSRHFFLVSKSPILRTPLSHEQGG
jgi:hypothetical protein